MSKAIKSNAARARQFFADKMAFTTGPVEISLKIEKGEDVSILDVGAATEENWRRDGNQVWFHFTSPANRKSFFELSRELFSGSFRITAMRDDHPAQE